MRTPPPPKKKKKHDERASLPVVERCLWAIIGMMALVACGTVALGLWLLLNRDDASTVTVTATATSIVQVVENPASDTPPPARTPDPVTPLLGGSPLPTQQAVFIPFSSATPTDTPTLRPARIVTAAPPPNDLRIPGVDWAGATIAVGRSDGVMLYNPAAIGAAPRSYSLATSEILNVALSPDGALVVGGAGDGQLIVWQAATGEILAALPAGRLPIWAVSFSPDGGQILAGTDGGFVRLWNLANQQETPLSAVNESVHSVAFHPSGEQLAAGTYTGRIVVWNAERTQIASLNAAHTGFVWALDYHPDGALLVSAGEDGRVVWWDTADFSQVAVIADLNGIPINDLAFNATGSQLAAATADGRVIIWDVATRRINRTLQHPVAVTALAFSPDDNRILTAALDGALRMWSPDSDTPRTLPGR